MQKGHIENSTLFYSATPEMIEEDLKKYNLKLLHHIAVDGPMFVYRDTVNMDWSLLKNCDCFSEKRIL